MKSRTWNPVALTCFAAFSTLVFNACDDSTSSPPATSAEARADLQALAAKVRYFAPPSTGGKDMTAGKRGAAKTGAAKGKEAGCDQQSRHIDTYQDPSISGGITTQTDTTESYTAAGLPVCAFDDTTAYELTNSSSKNDMLETWMQTRMDYPADFFSGDIKLTGHGTVHYLDGYQLTITSINIVFNVSEAKPKTYAMNLTLEKGYTVALGWNPAMDMMAEEEPGVDDLMVLGPIVKDGNTVGYFEVYGDDHVVIRDASRIVIEAHGAG